MAEAIRRGDRGDSKMLQACVIIDDPLLKETYGFLNYEKLLEAMQHYNFCSTIAFIPWNYTRTDMKVAKLFQENPDRFSLCIHGCNHTRAEFGSTDYDKLDYLSQLAMKRMMRHEESTGLPFDRVMVFPQGEFSKASMKALQANGYLAAVNHVIPDHWVMTSPGIVCWGLPLLVRRHINQIEGFKSDLLHGRPALMMLHHNSFRDGYDAVGDAIKKINDLGNIRWRTLGDIVRGVFPERVVTSHKRVFDSDSYRAEGNLRISARRHLCEFRDNYVSKSKALSYLLNLARPRGRRFTDY